MTSQYKLLELASPGLAPNLRATTLSHGCGTSTDTSTRPSKLEAAAIANEYTSAAPPLMGAVCVRTRMRQ